MLFRSYAFALRPDLAQAVAVEQSAGACRLVWNLALEQRQNHRRQYKRIVGRSIDYLSQARELTALREQFDFIRAVSQVSQQRTLRDLDEAYRRAFAGGAGFPKFRKKGAQDSFSFPGRVVAVERINKRWSRIRLPKIGWVKFRSSRPIAGSIREVGVSRGSAGWRLNICCEAPTVVRDNGLTVGIDRGVTVPLMLSDGTSFKLPTNVRCLELRHRSAQRVVARRQKGSRRWQKAVAGAASLKARQARARKHWAHETTTEIASRYSGVVLEALGTRRLTKSAAGSVNCPGKGVAQKRGLNRAILNVGWYQIARMLSYKVARYVEVSAAYTSQTCASCGVIDSRSRKSQAVFVCHACGVRDNADRNAAKVILNRGNTPGVEAADRAADEARTTRAS